jgi:L-ascorbate metabolism protein UlaG (beta-lactamase superfamily)
MVLGGGLAGIASAAGFAYRAAPAFWQQYASERKRPVPTAPHTPDPSKWPDTGLHAAWIGHSTVLLKIDGFTIITDPVFSTKVGIKRLVAPAMELKRLPRVDLILLSHAHMDHFDIPSLRRLESKDRALITASRTSDLLRVHRYEEVTELGWGQKHQVGPLNVQGLEVNHWGARVRTDTYRGYNGYLLTTGRYRVLFAGDTADTDKLERVAGSKSVDLAIMPVGAYNPWIHYHCNPEQSWRMSQEARSEFVMPVHNQTFQLSREPLHEPIERLENAAGAKADRIVLREIGQEFHLS